VKKYKYNEGGHIYYMKRDFSEKDKEKERKFISMAKAASGDSDSLDR